jgi:hypothetical protein
MKKIPTIFERDWEGDRSKVLDRKNPECAWVFAGEGKATRKLDGTSCMIRAGSPAALTNLSDQKFRIIPKPPGIIS